ncbi:hypothetical protein NDU88_002443 [Pleurodeles waltl]|uniref:Uncharacterized protein n=1 Tax=Pleurodeles waltl TaxID=8319 RepID=A0AAV7VZB5_PLEWA|nr:hypothetical protein NDU88_002440 [Pleurodeles waltl]KAJ1207051.1 hypothetical protein NDU88_002443 [Pleurodeles waltl]
MGVRGQRFNRPPCSPPIPDCLHLVLCLTPHQKRKKEGGLSFLNPSHIPVPFRKEPRACELHLSFSPVLCLSYSLLGQRSRGRGAFMRFSKNNALARIYSVCRARCTSSS